MIAFLSNLLLEVAKHRCNKALSQAFIKSSSTYQIKYALYILKKALLKPKLAVFKHTGSLEMYCFINRKYHFSFEQIYFEVYL